ncbi:hypothetical protein HMPREF9582_01487 [Cutibacterium acnes HL060PA1]|nr:hypothetical protein HMPREF9603_00932 [Cutibacterium acnes HL001PA1]EFT11212.1 hypothetical protein HMPREF9619_00375 [Cutibacterium acnes HL082PA2]EFT27271.1 hypothetical protein HMPREF9577_00048 [Cutibacterium acnes HL110PA3]EFT64377.1 hypothetical protein HMPREF9578_01641 [Cutibacterium acnes HL110PA4]EFT64658.1 hypothetical protein HMPREF9582_01487 [Cutibacterium acnes HL060PA1]EFT75822.1 hypothetical protein HMPREF9599_00646 [Cutibacterium acnes HL050PA2]EGE69023.1 hypothetical protein
MHLARRRTRGPIKKQRNGSLPVPIRRTERSCPRCPADILHLCGAV